VRSYHLALRFFSTDLPPGARNPDSATVGANQISINDSIILGAILAWRHRHGKSRSRQSGCSQPRVSQSGRRQSAGHHRAHPASPIPRGQSGPGQSRSRQPGPGNQALTDASYTITNEGNNEPHLTPFNSSIGALPAAHNSDHSEQALFHTASCRMPAPAIPTNVIVANITNRFS